MPGVSADAAEATLVEWAVAAGDSVTRGDVIATVETDKAVVDIEAEASGTLLKTFAVAGESVAIGGPIAVLVSEDDAGRDEAELLAELGLGPQAAGPLDAVDEERSQDTLVPGARPPIEHTSDEVVEPGGQPGEGRRVFATPLVRRLAAEAGVALEELTGTGPNGRIRRRDLEAALAERPSGPAGDAAAAPAAAPAEAGAQAQAATTATARSAQPSAAGYTDVPATRFRRAVAAALTASKQTVPHFYLKASCRVDELLRLREVVNAGGGPKVTINDFVVKAAAAAMLRVPEMNVVWTGDAVRRFESADVAVAMATERGLMTPVVRSVGSRSLTDVSAAIKDLAARASAGSLKQQELEGGSLTISNLGMYGVEEFAAIINPPHVGILAVGAVVPQAFEAADGGLELGRCLTVVLSVDHRPVDGALAAQWLQHLKSLLENPITILA
ncbi:dihydrolipoamide acetyltransferase family protein [Oryzobacter sp. R7]|uniref:dihydrolipoamide acetyltransferase family protein n=1 Tax=Oryzobacter faecalis TaxID=3388656 RepID=UPI00398CA181